MKSTTKLGELGEKLVAKWLQNQGYTILHYHWSCRWGEIDLIAHNQAENYPLPVNQAALLFVEVKTRSRGNWDLDGTLAITPAKQRRIMLTAQLFLSEYRDLADLSCRFDVALVRSHQIQQHIETQLPQSIQLGQKVNCGEYQLTLQNYISAAFNLNE